MIKLRSKPLFGNRVSYSNKKTKHKFCLNNINFRFYSFILGEIIRIKAKVKFIKLIKRYGGIDFFIINYRNLPRQFLFKKQAMLYLLRSV